jgi:hypothetical protein
MEERTRTSEEQTVLTDTEKDKNQASTGCDFDIPPAKGKRRMGRRRREGRRRKEEEKRRRWI